MHAGIGSSRAVHSDARTFESRERVFEQALYRFAFGLPLPADESRAVVRERQLERALVTELSTSNSQSRTRKRIGVLGNWELDIGS